ncbi:DUF4249 domain-containing protein [Runella salmonicolor]|uniref:DUF4249 domain-containing protein n=1 Tax=Runella salmonicolor TaxID=2950278 RepID=A0ABT1FLV4_9BACT|nr:DUF4249 domain-containing protein [Runella salmonicolor]MCP1382739.1 DUF4249 domain-containing protein [Runella salmonicolor]
MNIRPKTTFFNCLLLTLSAFYGCVEPYDITYSLNANVLSVEGFVSDQAGTTVSINIARNSNNSYYSEPLKKCVAEIRASDGSTIQLQEVADGIYAAPANFKGKIGQTYQLAFKTPDGKTYESSKELLSTSPEIKKIYQQFDQNGLLDNLGKNVVSSTVDVYLDVDDPKETQNYYLWRWKLYEEQSICITCTGGRLVNGQCVKINSRNPPDYDYQCDKQCWELIYNSTINILDDKFVNGRSITGRLIGKIPFYSPSQGCLLEIEQLALSPQAYQYFQLLSSQAQNTGTLTDTPPAAIIGNIRNVADSQDKVVGFFGAAGTRKVQYWINRALYPNPLVKTLLGRAPNYEITSFPPSAYPCVLSRTRTPIRPEGWQ